LKNIFDRGVQLQSDFTGMKEHNFTGECISYGLRIDELFNNTGN